MGAYFHVIDRRDSESIERFRRELGRLRETEHLHSDRRERVRRIARDIEFHVIPLGGDKSYKAVC